MEEKAQHVAVIVKRLKKAYPDARSELDFTTPFELMIGSILAAQNTDKNVNTVTPELFRKYPAPADYIKVPQEELEIDIYSTGFFRQKAKSIQAVCSRLIESFGGTLPQTMDEMLSLPGIGRKTANVVLGSGFGIASGIVVDTHVTRVSSRLGLTENKLAEKIEKDLLVLVPKKNWIAFGDWLTWHGRRICQAKKPQCTECVLADICPSYPLFVGED